VVLIAAELLVGALTGRYPFLDPRTSLFFTALLTVCGALGVAGAVTWSARRLAHPPARGRAHGRGRGPARPGRARRRDAAAPAQHRAPAGRLRPRAPPAGRRRGGGLGGLVPLRLLLAGSADVRPHHDPDRGPVPGPVPRPRRPGADRPHQAPDLVFGAVREAAARTGSGRVWLVAAESGDRSSAQIKSLDEIGQIVRRPLPRLALVDGTDARAPSQPRSSRHRTPPTP
jgi:hypothetical protein